MTNESWSAAFFLMAAIYVAPHIPDSFVNAFAIICIGFAIYAKFRGN